MLCVKLEGMIIALELCPIKERQNICLIVLSIVFSIVYSQPCGLTMSSEKAPVNEQCTKTLGSENMENSMAVVLYNEESILPLHKRERTFKYCGKEITIKQDWSGIGVAAVVWDAAEVLAEFLESTPDIVKGKLTIELGAGTGLVGIVAAFLGARITITDRQEVLDYLEKTVKYNLPTDIYKQTKILPLDWTKDLNKFHSTYDVILGADIVYIEEVFEDLLRTLIQLSDKDTLILLSCRIRYDRDTNFIMRLEEHFDVQKITYSKDKDVNLFKVTKR